MSSSHYYILKETKPVFHYLLAHRLYKFQDEEEEEEEDDEKRDEKSVKEKETQKIRFYQRQFCKLDGYIKWKDAAFQLEVAFGIRKKNTKEMMLKNNNNKKYKPPHSHLEAFVVNWKNLLGAPQKQQIHASEKLDSEYFVRDEYLILYCKPNPTDFHVYWPLSFVQEEESDSKKEESEDEKMQRYIQKINQETAKHLKEQKQLQKKQFFDKQNAPRTNLVTGKLRPKTTGFPLTFLKLAETEEEKNQAMIDPKTNLLYVFRQDRGSLFKQGQEEQNKQRMSGFVQFLQAEENKEEEEGT